jgi:hypothetical protein
MNPLVTSQLTEPSDDIDTKIHEDFMGMYMLNDISRKQVEFKYDNEMAGRVYQLWLNTGICLLKANAHSRNFRKLLEEKRAEFEKEVEQNGSGSIQHYYWDLSVEVEGMLTQLKAAMDSFAVVIGKVTGLNGIRSWSKARPTDETTEYSGQNIINSLTRNLPATELPKYQNLIDLINDNKEHLTKIIGARDRFTHPNESFMDFSTGFYYDANDKKIIEPAIKYGNDKAYIQSQFVRMTFDVVFEILVYSGITLLNGVALGMAIFKNGNEYAWGITNLAQDPNQK